MADVLGTVAPTRGIAPPCNGRPFLQEILMARPFTSTLLIPTLNEIDGMKVIMPQIQRDWVDQILILDGGSTDGTIEYARDNGYEVYVQQQRGIRHAYVEALPLVRGEILITFSPDGNSLAEAIPPLLDKMEEGYDMVIDLPLSWGCQEQRMTTC